jgi:hypothetical protein
MLPPALKSDEVRDRLIVASVFANGTQGGAGSPGENGPPCQRRLPHVVRQPPLLRVTAPYSLDVEKPEAVAKMKLVAEED